MASTNARPSASPRRVTAVAAAVTTAIHLPIFLLGGLAVLAREDITNLDEARVGALASVFFAVSALTSSFAGRLSDRWGPRIGINTSMVASAAALTSIGLARGTATLALGCALAGVANGIGQPAANHSLARWVRGARQGIAFGIKQSSVPTAGLLAGASIPLIGMTVGWRVTFVLGATAVLLTVALVPRRFGPTVQLHTASAGPADAPRRSLFVLMAAVACGSAAGNTIPAFFVLSAVDAGVATATAGVLLAIGGAAGIVARLSVGWLADRRGAGHLRFVAGMLALGAVGYILLAASSLGTAVIAAGAVLAFAAGWGWPGVTLLTTVRLFPSAPGAASGMILAGAASGGVIGPPVIGIVARAFGFTWAWCVVALLATAGATLMLVCRRSVLRWRAAVTSTDRDS